MSVTTRTAFLDSMSIYNNDLLVKSKNQRKLSWYDSFYDSLQRFYIQFLLVTTLYVMEPWERILVISIILFVISLVTYSAFVYIPFHLHHIFQSTIPTLSTVLMP